MPLEAPVPHDSFKMKHFFLALTVTFLKLSPRMLQSVRRHSAIVLTVTVNSMQEIHPVIYLLLKLNHS